jgi:hypothetical protein
VPMKLARSDPKRTLSEKEAAEFGALERAQAGDASALPVVRELFSRAPARINELGDLARQAENAWLERAAGQNLIFREAYARKLASLKSELAGPSPSRVEQLLVDRICACWIQLQLVECQAARNATAELELSAFLEDKQERAQRRYLRAIKALAQVRRLLGPTVQVNIAERQVNVANP